MKQIAAAAYRLEPPFQAVENCRKVRLLAIGSLLLCAFGQLLIDASGVNVACVFIVSITSAVTFNFVIRARVVRTLPLPALIVLGFNVSTMSGALIVQTVGLRSMVYNLQVPQLTFGLCAIFQVSLLVALVLLLSFSGLRSKIRAINRRVFSRMGIMKAPSPVQLWIMGFVGSAAMLYGDTNQYGDVGAKFIAGMTYLAFAPFVLPILDKIFPTSHSSPAQNSSKWFLFGYLALLVFIAVVRNSRATFVIGIANLGVAALLLLLLGQLRVTSRLRRSLAIGSMVALIASPFLADLATAMVVVRSARADVSTERLVSLTLDAFNDKQELEQYRKAAAILAGSGDYEENYLANPFLARFVNTKFFDNTLSYPDVRVGARADKILSVTVDKIGALLPTPVLDGLGIDINKDNLKFSMGDALYDAQSGGTLGEYKTGSPIGHGMALMGPLIFIAVVPLFLLTFMAVQSLTLSVGSYVIISPVILLQLITIYGLAAGDSLVDPIGLMLRTLPQNILIYWAIFHATYWLSRFRKRHHKMA